MGLCWGCLLRAQLHYLTSFPLYKIMQFLLLGLKHYPWFYIANIFLVDLIFLLGDLDPT